MRRRLAAVAVAALVVLGAGCAQIPTSGPIIGSRPIEAQGQQPPFIQVEAPPPQPGDDSPSIVDGFIEAMASYEPSYETARMFLTEDARLSWDTSAGITIYTGARPTIDAVGTNTVRVTMSVSGTVGQDGTYTPALAGTTRELQFRLEQVNGEWRIANPPEGILIAEFSFGREYEPHNVYFFNPSFDVLVPDPVYLPKNEKVATLLAQKVLAGPSAWLAPAVRTAFPNDTELAVNAVPVESGTAAVELSEEVVTASPEDRELMTAQLVWTLGDLPEVEDVAVSSGGIPLPPGGEAAARTDSEMAKYDPAVLSADTPMYLVAETGVASLIDGEVVPVRGPLGAMAGVREVAVNVGGNRAVVVTGSGNALQVASFGDDEVTETVAQGVDLWSPAWDRTGLIWAVDHGVDGHGVVVSRSDGSPVDVVAPELDGHDVGRLAVSLDGTRIALILDGRAFVGNLVRDEARSTIRIDQLRPIGPDGEAVDVGWSAADSVVVLLGTENQEPLPFVVGLSGQVAAPRGLVVDDAIGLAAAPPGERRLGLETAEGVLLEQRPGNRWSQIATGRSLTYPG